MLEPFTSRSYSSLQINSFMRGELYKICKLARVIDILTLTLTGATGSSGKILSLMLVKESILGKGGGNS